MTSDEQETPTPEQKASGYKDLVVWQKGIVLVKQVYRLTRAFPVEERFALSIQMRRAAVSIPSNIAEGQARHTTKEFVRFLSHAEGSLAEVNTQLVIAQELGYCKLAETAPVAQLADELRRMLNALRRKLTVRR